MNIELRRKLFHIFSILLWLLPLFLLPKPLLLLLCLLVILYFGKTKIGNKSLEGALAFFVSTSLVLFPFLGPKAFLVALAGTLVELFSKRVDDNFLLPLVGSLVACL
jgi:dolichol kinase